MAWVRFLLGFASRRCMSGEGLFSIVSVIGGMIAARMASSTTPVMRHSELVAPASASASGEKLQDIPVQIIDQQGHDEVGV